jgi:hypothetical protein
MMVMAVTKKKQARLVGRDRTSYHGWQFEIWDIGGGRGIDVDFNQCSYGTGKPATMAFPMDLRKYSVSQQALGYWPYNAIGGKAISDLGYEPIEDGDEDE